MTFETDVESLAIRSYHFDDWLWTR